MFGGNDWFAEEESDRNSEERVYSGEFTSIKINSYSHSLPSARMRSEGTVVGVCLSVCLSGLYLAGRAFIRSTNDATYLAGNEMEKFCAILSETSPLQSWSPTGIVQYS